MKRSLGAFFMFSLLFTIFSAGSVFADTPVQDTLTQAFEGIREFVNGDSEAAEGFGVVLLVLFYFAIFSVVFRKIPVFSNNKNAANIAAFSVSAITTYASVQYIGADNVLGSLGGELIGYLVLAGVIFTLFKSFKSISNSELGGFLKFFFYSLCIVLAYMFVTNVGFDLIEKVEDDGGELVLFDDLIKLLSSGIFVVTFTILFFVVTVIAPIALLVFIIGKGFSKFKRNKEQTSGDISRRALEKIDEEAARLDSVFNSLQSFLNKRYSEVSKAKSAPNYSEQNVDDELNSQQSGGSKLPN